MSTQLMISMLKQAETGNQMLAILDSFTAQDSGSDYNEPTLETIEF